MNQKQFQRFIDRDETMVDAGYLDDTAVPQHRVGRGSGGSKLLELKPSNIIVFTSLRNGLIESSADEREHARMCGWSLRSYDDPLMVPVFHTYRGWVMLDDDYGWRQATTDEVKGWLEKVKNG